MATVIGRLAGSAAFADVILNRQRTSSRNGILKAEAVLLAAQMLASAGMLRPSDLADASPARFAAIQDAWKKVPGPSSMISAAEAEMLVTAAAEFARARSARARVRDLASSALIGVQRRHPGEGHE